MNRLVQVVQDLSKVRSLPEIVTIVRSAARQLSQADGATFVLRDNGYCFYVDEDAIGPLWKGKRFPLSACVSGWAMLNKQPIAIPDIFKDPRVPIEAYRPTFVKSLAMMPIRESDPLGAIGIYWASFHEATAEEISLMQALANVTSVAIENVQLISSLEDQVRELEHANRAKDDFLMLISHELRTPLNSIMGWSDLLKDADAPEDLRPGLQAIHRNSVLQCRVFDSLLDAAQMARGRFSIEKENLDLRPLVEEALRNVRASALKKRVELVYQCRLSEANVQGDAKRLRQILEILMDNAIKFSFPDGKVWLSLSQEGPSLCFKIRDQGVGIDSRGGHDPFDRFSQSEAYLTRTHGGLGLSLAMSKTIAELHRGQISFTSAGSNQGSEFRLTLPRTEDAVQSALSF